MRVLTGPVILIVSIKMKTIYIILIFCLLAFSTHGLADSPMAPYPWVTTSNRGTYLFKMVPAKWVENDSNYTISREACGVAYTISAEGEFEEIWRTEGWYTFEGHLSEDGRYFVRFGLWASDQEHHTDLAIAFYNQGNLLKAYRVRELIKKPELLEYSVSHYRWRPQTQTLPNGFQDSRFHLVMIDKTTYSFDIQTGKILSSSIDAEAQSTREIREQQQNEASKKGRALLDMSSFKIAYEEHYVFSQIEASYGSTYGVFFDEPEWRADLAPKKRYSHPCKVSAVFPITDDNKIDINIAPQEIDTALERCFAHSFVTHRFETGGATGIRLRITGDRLHWDTQELKEFLKKIKGVDVDDKDLRHWAYIIIDAKEPRYTSFYLNVKTNDLIYEDQSKWPWEPILVQNRVSDPK